MLIYEKVYLEIENDLRNIESILYKYYKDELSSDAAFIPGSRYPISISKINKNTIASPMPINGLVSAGILKELILADHYRSLSITDREEHEMLAISNIISVGYSNTSAIYDLVGISDSISLGFSGIIKCFFEYITDDDMVQLSILYNNLVPRVKSYIDKKYRDHIIDITIDNNYIELTIFEHIYTRMYIKEKKHE